MLNFTTRHLQTIILLFALCATILNLILVVVIYKTNNRFCNPSSSSSASSSSSLIMRKNDSTSDDETEQSNCKRLKNDVFINYSFEDIGNGFISHLKRSLTRHGFFISDHKDLQVGQDACSEVLKNIEESEIYVVVFSNNYACSVRSLDELVDIMECLGKFDQRKVLPVFYKVEPSDVRNQEGSFKEAFQTHEADEDIDLERVQKWKQALKDAGQLSGLTMQNRDEGKFVSKIVKQLEKMQSPQELHVADHPVEIGSRAEELISTLRLDCEDVLVVAVFGISGIGKTTIVKATYNKISSYFDVSCFLGDMHYHGKIELQNQLISRLRVTQYDKFPTMHHPIDEITAIKKLIGRRKILLVLDDVDNFEQLKSLGINPAWFYKGSRIIVITREKQSLGTIPYTSYQTTELNRRESLSLFNRLMFSRDNNHVDMKFIEEVAALAGGLPLVLEVWSRYFIGHERKLWPSLLKELKRIPHGDVQKQLQMSYDSLSVNAKILFLDIACFFDGMDKELVVQVLHDEELAFFPDILIQHLVDKFLVRDHNICTMNKVIMEMGQEVVRQEDEGEPGKRTRLMGYRDVVRVLEDCSGTDSVRSIKLDPSDWKDWATVQLEAFKKISNLRFIKLGERSSLEWSCSSNDDMSACFSFKHLKYLEWVDFPCKSLDNIDMGNVVVIKLQYSKLEKLWEGTNKNFKKLKILHVSSYSLTKTGNFTGLENLEELSLDGCENLEELDSSIGCLQKLVDLNLSRCKNLEELDSSIGCLQKLVSLDLSNCTRLKRLPWEMICKLTSLQNLDLSGCTNLPEISHEIGRICQLHQLKQLNLIGWANLKSIPDLPPSIKMLQAHLCSNLVNLPSNCSELQFITQLRLEFCCKLGSEGFTQVTRLRNLQRLEMGYCNISQVSSGIGNLVSLEQLDLSYNTFSSLPESFSNLSKLEDLAIDGCSQLQSLPPLPSQLNNIRATDCGSLDVMPFDSMQKAYTFPSKMFKESLMNTEGLFIDLSRKELPEWCTYRNSGNNDLSFKAPIRFDSKICGLILRATADYWTFSTIHNKTKGKSHRMGMRRLWEIGGIEKCTLKVVFYPLNDKTVVVEAGDTVELRFDHATSFGLRLVYEDDVVDSGLALPS